MFTQRRLIFVLISLGTAIPLCAQNPQIGGGNINTVAGTGTSTALNFPIGDADTAEQFGQSAADAAGNVYIPDKGNHRILKLDTNGIVTTVAGIAGKAGYDGDDKPATAALLNSPCGVVLDSANNIYFTDQGNNLVRRVDSQGMITRVAGKVGAGSLGDGGPATEARLNFPCGLSLDAAGNLYIADMVHDRVRVVAADTKVIATLAGTGAHSDGDPQSDNVPATSINLGWPSAALVDGTGKNLFISDMHNNVIRVVDLQTGLIRRIAGTGRHGDDNPAGNTGPATQAALGYPQGMALDAAGDLFIADTHNNAIRKITSPLSPGVAIDIPVGLGTYEYGGDGGLAWYALMKYPSGVAFDGAGNLYITDWENDRVRKAVPGTTPPQLVILPGGLVDGAAFTAAPAAVAPGSIISIFGRRMAPGIALSGAIPLPRALLDPPVSVSVTSGNNTYFLPLFYVSPDQINAQLPVELPTDKPPFAIARMGSQQGDPFPFNVSPSAPRIFVNPFFDANGNYFERAIAFNQDGTLNSSTSPAAHGSVIVAYLTGEGALNPPIPTGEAAPLSPLSKATLKFSAIVGGKLARVDYLGATPTFVGLSQANIVVPDNAPVGDQELALNVGGHDSNRPLVTIK